MTHQGARGIILCGQHTFRHDSNEDRHTYNFLLLSACKAKLHGTLITFLIVIRVIIIIKTMMLH